MNDPVEALIVDMLEWIGPRSRPYAEVIETWRTSCPRLPAWEEANARGFLEHTHAPGEGAMIALSGVGRYHLSMARRPHIVHSSEEGSR